MGMPQMTRAMKATSPATPESAPSRTRATVMPAPNTAATASVVRSGVHSAAQKIMAIARNTLVLVCWSTCRFSSASMMSIAAKASAAPTGLRRAQARQAAMASPSAIASARGLPGSSARAISIVMVTAASSAMACRRAVGPGSLMARKVVPPRGRVVVRKEDLTV